jgi:hypothetical protein
MGLLYRLLLLAAVFGVGVLARQHWKRQARWRLAGIDRGAICSTCSSKDMRVENDIAHCDACGAQRDLAAMRKHQITTAELDAMLKPQERERW